MLETHCKYDDDDKLITVSTLNLFVFNPIIDWSILYNIFCLE